MEKVAIGMSGGVDSSVAAYLLKKQGLKVFGLFMKNWAEDGESCRSAKDYEDAARVCGILNIPLYSINFVKEYWDLVFSSFLKELKLGYTPNPDILCNKEIKFNIFFEKAKRLGADFLATGHYCQTDKGKLLKGEDQEKDQSYFLHAITGEVLNQVLFPIGKYTKTEIRNIARENGLPTHDKKDSTGICFIGKRNFKKFIQGYIPYHPGNFENLKGEVIGQHDGAAYYTIGQRKGLGIGGPGNPWFVVGKDVKRNVVIVEQGENHPALYSSNLIAIEPTFIDGKAPDKFPFHCTAKIRYRQTDQPCVIKSIKNQTIEVAFHQPQRAITPRQSIVFYQGNVCLGGALIEKAYL